MQKHEALALLKEIVGCQAAVPNWLAIREKEPNNYQISIKGYYDKEKIRVIVQKSNCAVKESSDLLTIQ
jgi:hypothetical protein